MLVNVWPASAQPRPLDISRFHYQLKQRQAEATAKVAAPASFGRPQLVVTCDCFGPFVGIAGIYDLGCVF